MTIEQQIQYCIKAAFLDYLEGEEGETESEITIHATKLDNLPDEEFDDQLYPAIVINTGTPVPDGHKSAILTVPMWITCHSYLPSDPKREAASEMAEAVFMVISQIQDWEDFLPEDATAEVNAVLIESGEEPTVMGPLFAQTTNCRVAACYHNNGGA
jgi:hypothetical protein